MAEKAKQQTWWERHGMGSFEDMPPALKEELRDDIAKLNPMSALFGTTDEVGESMLSPANWGKGQRYDPYRMASKLMAILEGLGRGTANALGYASFDPNTVNYKSVERQADQQWTMDPDTGFPVEVAGAPQHTRQSERLPSIPSDPSFVSPGMRDYGNTPVTPEDIQRWSSVLNQTTVPKSTPPMPTKKPKAPAKKKVVSDEWNTIVTGLGPYANSR